MDEPQSQPPPELSNEQIKDYLLQRWTNFACSRCGRNDWELSQQHTVSAKLPVASPSSVAIVGTHHVPAIFVACQFCGTLEFVAQAVIERWVRERRNG